MAEKLFSPADRAIITEAIRNAEAKTSGEIQVHIESHCSGEVLDRAAEVFEKLKMHRTTYRNAVLFYLAAEDHKFAILGDAGINQVVPENFWEAIKDEMVVHFKKREFTEGLRKGIELSGQQLQQHFPFDQKGDINELPNEISFD
ncbi:TLP18.3, Psb32 and MOLO-1 founding protein of phosphatase [Cyclobacterium xiamenense]|uniref:TLP18.3, Psb32 and MOLO-1 founding protein of phosphatase n=1 Tax=Cyclobacterium xiamenense TaxID=1297121 RepID=A0A1H6THR0_9BACT|nr:TPM domain-containing protein [Cyclobacterium xiamenense]SEI78826.1 TLP18.3, Psb32 and MOLO-1 founding protein of phosphatase [Cyclobacterium xiamenense]